jgi:hypothetical protein
MLECAQVGANFFKFVTADLIRHIDVNKMATAFDGTRIEAFNAHQ